MAGGKVADNYAVVHDRLISRGGSERVAIAIAEALDATLYTARYEPEKTFEVCRNLDIRDLKGIPEPEISQLYPLVRMLDAAKFSKLEELSEYDAVWLSGQWAHFAAKNNPRNLAYIHSVAKWTPVVTKIGKRRGKPISVDPIEEIFERTPGKKRKVKNRYGQMLEIKIPSVPLFIYNHRHRVGNWSKVRKLHRHTYSGNLLRINTTASVVDVSPGHSLIRASGIPVRGDEVKIGDKLACPGLNPLPIKKQGLFVGSEELAWLYGFFVAEGNITEQKRKDEDSTRAGCKVWNTNKDLLKKVRAIYKGNFHRSANIRKKKDVYGLIFYGYDVKNLFQKFYTCHEEKKVPSEILNAPLRIKRSFLEGYYEGDASLALGGGLLDFKTSSQTLAQGIMMLQRNLDGNSFGIDVMDDEPNSFNVHVNKGSENRKSRGLVKKVFRVPYEGWIYDLETSDETFTGGPGCLSLHNSPPRFIYDLREHVRRRFSQPSRTIFDMWSRFWTSLDQRAAEHIGKAVANSENVRRRIKRFYRRDAEIVHPPIDVEKFYRADSENYYLAVNRITPEKGVHIQLDAFESLPDENLIIVGKAEHGTEYQSEMADRIKEMENVEWIPSASEEELVELYARAKATVHTGKDEDFGISPIESMASGTIPIAVDEGGYKWTVDHGRTGLLIGEPYVKNFIKTINDFDPSSLDGDELVAEADKYNKERFIEEIREATEGL